MRYTLAVIANRIVSLFEVGGWLRPALTWPRFSLSSFVILSRVRRSGICPRTIIDVGANVGQFSVAAANLFPLAQVLAFEPDPDSFRELQRTTAKIGRVRCRQAAIGDTSGTARLLVQKNRQQSSLLPSESAAERAIEVELLCLDAALQGEVLARPVLLKVDVQGFEDRVLAGASGVLPKVDALILEAAYRTSYDGQVRFPQLVIAAEQAGFRFLHPVSQLISRETGLPIEADLLFVRTA